MKIVTLGLVFVLVASTLAIRLPDTMIGVCAEMCSNSLIIRATSGLGGCPDGYVCRSNGCGHSCQPILVKRFCPPFFKGICLPDNINLV